VRVGLVRPPGGAREAASSTRQLDLHHPALLGQAAVYEFIRRGNFEPNLTRVNGC
jgi:DNA-binding transcriptional MocR family regulator